jgi:hypothetical protein
MLSCWTFSRAASLFELIPGALRLPFVPGRGYSQTLFLPCKSVRFRGYLCGAVSVKESSFRIGSGATAFGEIIVFLVSHISVPLESPSSRLSPRGPE